jgi:hypothetical protein
MTADLGISNWTSKDMFWISKEKWMNIKEYDVGEVEGDLWISRRRSEDKKKEIQG